MQSGDPFTTKSIPTLLLLGDSLTQYSFSKDGGWAAEVADKLQRRCDVLSRGLSGYNTRWYRHYLSDILAPFSSNKTSQVVGLTIFLGANDAADKDLNAHQHVPLAEYEENLVALVKGVIEHFPSLGEQKGHRIIIISPPPVDEVARSKHCENMNTELDRFNTVTEAYAIAARSAAERAGVAFVDFYHIARKAGIPSHCETANGNNGNKYSSFFTDGLHLGVDGAAMLASTLWPFVDTITKDLPAFLPNWRDVKVLPTE